MEFPPPAAYDQRAGSLLRGVANDLKRDDLTAEKELGLPAGTFADLSTGRLPLTWEIIRSVAATWPVNERDLLPVHDDCPAGVLISRLPDSIASSRTLQRGGRDYYEYRDTAMSRLASYRPEWIKMLCRVRDSDPHNPAVQWNNGHLLYQFTYFIGPVNYYYESQGRRFCAELDTGDSVWGLPFAPHSFAVRSDTEDGYILALTYGGELPGDAQQELSALGAHAARALMIPSGTDTQVRAALIDSSLRARLMSVEYLAVQAGIAEARMRDICSAEAAPHDSEIERIASVLGLSVRDLSPPKTKTSDGVSVQRHAAAPGWQWPNDRQPAYRITSLASDPSHPDTAGLEIEVLADSQDGWATTHQHQYLYVLGQAGLRLTWQLHGEPEATVLRPGESCYIRPGTKLALTRAEKRDAKALLLRIGGHFGIDLRFALGLMPPGALERYIQEDRMWYAGSS